MKRLLGGGWVHGSNLSNTSLFKLGKKAQAAVTSIIIATYWEHQ